MPIQLHTTLAVPQARRSLRCLIVCVLGPLFATLAHADAVTDWNETAIRAAASIGISTGAQSRLVAIAHAAMFDAVNSIERKYTKYAAEVSPPAGASAEAAAISAAHAVLTQLVPDQKKMLDAALTTTLTKVADGPAKDAGVAVGQEVAARLLELRSTDGIDAKVAYTPGTAPGAWQPTPPDFRAAVGPERGAVKAFVLKSSDQFTLPGPPALDSEVFARDMLELQSVGAHGNTSRTAEQTEVAIYWTVWTHMPFNAAARAAVTKRGTSLVDNARLFALLNMAGADSQTACWYWKYRFNFWRPVTAIHAADSAKNAALKSDPKWEPLLNTPAHPDYPSGHATYGGAAAEVLKAVLGDDRVDVSFVSTGVTRTYTSFSQLDREVIDARVWGGIHFRQTDEDSSALGHKIGDYTVGTWLRPLSPNVGLR
ncbi:MAG TPA: vanadium-dependent haloperoxidase [Candidatus Tectomicrobia bacterium]